MKIKKITLVITYLLSTTAAFGMRYAPQQEEMDPEPHLLIIPGQNCLGGRHHNMKTVLPALLQNKHKAETPESLFFIDFGQANCQYYVKKLVSLEGLNNKKIIMYASSQGTATAINYAAKNPNAVKAIILEALMLSGNSAINHTIKNGFPPATYLPGSYYWLPYIAKFRFPGYAPAGEQPIFNADKLPTNIPIIIVHNVRDPQLSYEDAQALYAFLKDRNQNDVYLISHDNGDWGHVELLNKSNISEINAIQQILRNHHLYQDFENVVQEMKRNPGVLQDFKDLDLPIPHTLENIDEKFQPQVKPAWREHWRHLFQKETSLRWFDKFLKTALCGLIIYLLQTTGMAEKVFEKYFSR